jgi:hypothetical protein
MRPSVSAISSTILFNAGTSRTSIWRYVSEVFGRDAMVWNSGEGSGRRSRA